MKKKVLIIYAHAGGGHLRLAQVVSDSLHEFYKDKFEISILDPFPSVYGGFYGLVGASFQDLWAFGYYLTDNKLASKLIHFLNWMVIGENLKDIIIREKPDIIVSNNSLATEEIKRAAKIIGIKPKIVVQFADPFSIHQTWFTFGGADLYLSPTEEVTEIAVRSGLSREKIKTVGWPVRRNFGEKSIDREKSDKFTILIGGSGQGGGRVLDVVKALKKSKILVEKTKLVVVCGVNESLYSQVEKIAKKFKFIIPFRFVENMPSLIGTCDLVIGKAGPNFLFETIFSQKVFIATGCLPGQEDGNLEFILKKDVGFVQKDMGLLTKLVEEIVADPKILASKIQNIERVKKEHNLARKRLVEEINKI